MKAFKAIFVFAALFFAVQMYAQDTYTLSSRGTQVDFVLDAGDTLSNNSTTLSKVIDLRNKSVVQLYSLQVTVDSISGTPTEAWVLAGSHDGTNYSTITTVNWAGTSSDTTFVYTDISTGVAWNYLRVRGTESGTAKGQLTELVGKIVDEVK